MNELKTRLHEAIGLPEKRWSESRFDRLALMLFSHQYHNCAAYRRLCDASGATPESVKSWKGIPPVPVSVFKRVRLFAGADGTCAHEFTTSGTTQGNKGTSCFSADGLALMEQSIVVNAQRMLFPDVKRMHILVLAPSPQMAPQMIMAWGMARLIERFGTRESTFLVGPQGLDVPRLVATLRRFEQRKEPVCIIGASFGFVNLLDGLAAKEVRFRLPPGSRAMDAGGYKGKSRVLARADLLRLIREGFGVPPEHAVNLLGMTELATQFYDDTLAADAAGRRATGLKQPPPWTRTRAVDPETLKDIPEGEQGVLLHLDLANLDTPACVLTDDVGRVRPGGFEILGRLSADESRGCSLTVDELTRTAG